MINDVTLAAFADELEKIANRFSKFLRSAPLAKVRPAVENAIGSAAPTFYKDVELNKNLKALRSGDSVNRESLVKAVRTRLKAGFPDSVTKKLNRTPYEPDFARTFKDRKNSPLVKILHGGTEPELQSILKYGPNAPIPAAPGVAGRNELGGMFVHKSTDRLGERSLTAYGQRRADYAGGSPAVLTAEVPEGLLSERGRLGGGEYVLPASLWSYVQNAKVTKLAEELEKIASSNGGYKRVFKVKRLFGNIKRMHRKRNIKRVHKKWKYKRPSVGGGGGNGGGSGGGNS